MMLFNVICPSVGMAMDLLNVLGTSHHDFYFCKSRNKVEAVDVICGYLRLCGSEFGHALCYFL